MNTKITAEKIMVAVIVVLFGSFVFESYLSVSGQNYYETEIAEYDTFKITDTVEGYIIRDDSIVSDRANGTVIPTVAEGTKVEKNGEVARVFKNTEYALNIAKRNSIQQELDYYTNLKTSSDDYVNNVSVYSKNILSSVYSYAAAIDSGSKSDAEAASDDVREYMTVKQIVMGQQINVEEKIADLESQLNAVNSADLDSTYSSITIDKSGYYFSDSDGYEGIADYDNVENISCEEIEALMSSVPDSDVGVGKVVYNPLWYFVCVMTKKQAANLEVGYYYSISFRDSAADDIAMKVVALNDEKDSSNVAVVFSSKVMNEDVASLRIVTADVCFEEYTGIVVPNNAVRTVTFTEEQDVLDENGNKTGEKEEVEVDRTGVYIKLNNISKFREIKIIYRNSEYTLAEYVADNESGRYLKIHDEIFVKGVNFEDEHIITGGYF